MENINFGKNVHVHPTAIIYPNVILHDNVFIEPYCIIGQPTGDYYKNPENHEFKVTEIGANSVIRSNTVIYENVKVGENFQTGHNVTIREETIIGKNCSVGTLCDLQGKTVIGDFTRLHSNVHIGQFTRIGNYVWIFPYVVTTNDMYPPMDRLEGVTIEDYALITTGSILLPGVVIGANSMVAAGSVVSKDVKQNMVVMGVPAREKCPITDIRDQDGEMVYPWPEHMKEYRGYPWQTEKEFSKKRQ